MKRLLSIFFLIAFSNSLLDAQTLDRVYQRARDLWALRSSGNKFEASKFVEPAGQKEFFSFQEPLKAEVASIELSGIPTAVIVVSKVQMIMPEVGQIDRVVRESWIWNGTDWFLHVEPASPFPFDTHTSSQASNAPPRKSIQVDFLQHDIDLGKHVQGEVVPGRLEFRGDQKEIVTVRPADMQGLTFDSIVWQAPDRGILKFALDTALISEPFQKSLRFDFLDLTGALHPTTIEMRANIEGRVRFTQFPKVLDTHSDGICILQIQNLSSKAVRLLTATIGNGEYRMDSAPDSIGPHEIGTIKLSYNAKASNASLNMKFSADLLGNRSIVVPIQLAVAPTSTPTFTREELEEQIRKTPQLPLPKPRP